MTQEPEEVGNYSALQAPSKECLHS